MQIEVEFVSYRMFVNLFMKHMNRLKDPTLLDEYFQINVYDLFLWLYFCTFILLKEQLLL